MEDREPHHPPPLSVAFTSTGFSFGVFISSFSFDVSSSSSSPGNNSLLDAVEGVSEGVSESDKDGADAGVSEGV